MAAVKCGCGWGWEGPEHSTPNGIACPPLKMWPRGSWLQHCADASHGALGLQKDHETRDADSDNPLCRHSPHTQCPPTCICVQSAKCQQLPRFTYCGWSPAAYSASAAEGWHLPGGGGLGGGGLGGGGLGGAGGEGEGGGGGDGLHRIAGGCNV